MENTLLRLSRLLSDLLRIDVEDVRPDVPLTQLLDRYEGDSLDRVEWVIKAPTSTRSATGP